MNELTRNVIVNQEQQESSIRKRDEMTRRELVLKVTVLKETEDDLAVDVLRATRA